MLISRALSGSKDRALEAERIRGALEQEDETYQRAVEQLHKATRSIGTPAAERDAALATIQSCRFNQRWYLQQLAGLADEEREERLERIGERSANAATSSSTAASLAVLVALLSTIATGVQAYVAWRTLARHPVELARPAPVVPALPDMKLREPTLRVHPPPRD